jgi:hypothetical protein
LDGTASKQVSICLSFYCGISAGNFENKGVEGGVRGRSEVDSQLKKRSDLNFAAVSRFFFAVCVFQVMD